MDDVIDNHIFGKERSVEWEMQQVSVMGKTKYQEVSRIMTSIFIT
jgi:hypothetical protein